MQTVKYSKFKTLFRLADERRRSSFSFTVMHSPPPPFGFIFAQRNVQEEAETGTKLLLAWRRFYTLGGSYVIRLFQC